MSQLFCIFKRGHTAQKHENHIQTYIIPAVCPQKATFNIWEFPQHLPQFQAKFHSDMLFFQDCKFLGMPQLQMELVHNKTLLSTHVCYSCIPCNDPADSIYIQQHRFKLTTAVSSHAQSKKSLITPHTNNTRFKHTNDCEETSHYSFFVICDKWKK